MITVHTTKKLFDRLPLDSKGQLPGEIDRKASLLTPFDRWHASLFLLHSEPAVLFMHDQTRFPVLVTGIERHGIALIEQRFRDILVGTLIRLGADENQLQRACSYLQPMRFTRKTCRSVMGSITHAALELQKTIMPLHLQTVSESQACAELADTPSLLRSPRTMQIPALEMLKLLGTEEEIAESQLIERFLKDQTPSGNARNDLSLLMGVEEELRALGALETWLTPGTGTHRRQSAELEKNTAVNVLSFSKKSRRRED